MSRAALPAAAAAHFLARASRAQTKASTTNEAAATIAAYSHTGVGVVLVVSAAAGVDAAGPGVALRGIPTLPRSGPDAVAVVPVVGVGVAAGGGFAAAAGELAAAMRLAVAAALNVSTASARFPGTHGRRQRRDAKGTRGAADAADAPRAAIKLGAASRRSRSWARRK